MMRPVSVALPPNKPDNVTTSFTGTGKSRRIVVTWNDNSINETAFLVQRTADGTTWTTAGTIPSPLDLPNIHESRTFTDPSANASTAYLYRVVAQNAVGYGGGFPALTVQSVSTTVGVNAPAAPTSLTATPQTGPKVSLTWRDNATNETGFSVERSTDGVTFSPIGTASPRTSVGNVTFVDNGVSAGATYTYRVAAVNVAGTSGYSNTATAAIPAVPAAPSAISGTAVRFGSGERVTLSWTDNATNESGFTIQWSSASGGSIAGSSTAASNATTFTTGTITRQSWWFRVGATNIGGTSWSAWVQVAAAP